nr:MAG TPA: hypothetical protein [Caudoviricetes sp.]
MATTVLPQPCKRFENLSTLEWTTKFFQAGNDVLQEANRRERWVTQYDWYRDNSLEQTRILAEKLTEVITLCVSWMEAMGYDEGMRGWVQMTVNDKHQACGHTE